MEIDGQSVPLTFAGPRGVVVPPRVPHVLADPVPARAFGRRAIARYTSIWLRLRALVADAATDTFPSYADASTLGMVNPTTIEEGGFAGTKAWLHADAVDDQVDRTGPLTALATIGGASPFAGTYNVPPLLLGRFVDPGIMRSRR